MEKIYQVFVSSTYEDLKDERRKAMEALLSSSCIPTGMELFPAADEEQFEFIKKIIDKCDYYVLIIGSRYGSLAPDGFSYTEKEYDYAFSKKIKIITLICNAQSTSTESDLLKKKLENFRIKVSDGRIVDYWNNSQNLEYKTHKAIVHAKENYEAIGWVRADKVASESLLLELNDARKEINNLQNKLKSLDNSIIENLIGLDTTYKISGTQSNGHMQYPWSIEKSWFYYFAAISPSLIQPIHEIGFKIKFEQVLKSNSSLNNYEITISDSDFDTIKIQFKALGLIDYQVLNTVSNGVGLFWSLTPKGGKVMLEIRTIKNT